MNLLPRLLKFWCKKQNRNEISLSNKKCAESVGRSLSESARNALASAVRTRLAPGKTQKKKKKKRWASACNPSREPFEIARIVERGARSRACSLLSDSRGVFGVDRGGSAEAEPARLLNMLETSPGRQRSRMKKAGTGAYVVTTVRGDCAMMAALRHETAIFFFFFFVFCSPPHTSKASISGDERAV